MIKDESKKRAWLVCIGCALVYGAIFGLLYNCTGLVLSVVAEECGYTNTHISIFHTLKTVASALFLPLTAKWYAGEKYRPALLLASAVCVLCYVCMTRFTALWQWYAAAIVFGAAYSGLVMFSSVFINNWFAKNNGTALSVALFPAGIIGIFTNKLTGKLILLWGWRPAILLLCGLVLLITVPSICFLLKLRPGEGEHRYGEEEASPEAEALTEPAPEVKAAGRWILPLCYLALIGGYCYNKMNDFLPQVAALAGAGVTVRANVAAWGMAGNVTLKLASGYMIDRLGIFRSLVIWYVMLVAASAVFMLPGLSPGMMYLAAVLYAANYGVQIIGSTALMLRCFGKEHYEDKLSRFMSVGCFACAALVLLAGVILDMDNGVHMLFLGWLVFCLLSLAASLAVKRFVTASEKKNTQAAG